MESASIQARCYQRTGACARRAILTLALAGALLAGCTRAELENKATAYNAAIATSTNEAILLNVVRASQRAPMSFTILGQVTATPNLSGSAAGTFNFNPYGLLTYNVNPSVKYDGGFSQYTMQNANTMETIEKIQSPITFPLVKRFRDLRWPEELLDLMFISSVSIKPETLRPILRQVERMCRAPVDGRTRFYCRIIEEQKAAREAARCTNEFSGTFVNTARDLCGMANFQIFLRTLRVVHLDPLDARFARGVVLRSPEGMLYYLGELTAAQNYSIVPYMPTTVIGTTVGAADERRKLVPLFVVRRGVAGPFEAAVQVSYDGDHFYIPRPALGTAEEARSLQVLDLISQIIALLTTSSNLPKNSIIGVIASP